jgi:ureidoglycolate lyase
MQAAQELLNVEATTKLPLFELPVVRANKESVAPFGTFLGTDIERPGLSIPYYTGTVIEGHNFDFHYSGRATLRCARIFQRPWEIIWCERHVQLSQLFVPLGVKGMIMALAPPNHQEGRSQPELAAMRAVEFGPGEGVILHCGTWHDFPLCTQDEVTVLMANSDNVITSLSEVAGPCERNDGDVFKIHVPTRLGVHLVIPKGSWR